MIISKRLLYEIIKKVVFEDDQEKEKKEKEKSKKSDGVSSGALPKDTKFIGKDTLIKNKKSGVKYTILTNDVGEKEVYVKRPNTSDHEDNEVFSMKSDDLLKNYQLVWEKNEKYS